MAKKPPTPLAVETLKHDEARRKSIPTVAAGANVYEYGRFENVVSGARRRVCEVGAQRWVHRSLKAALPRRRKLQEARRKPFD